MIHERPNIDPDNIQHVYPVNDLEDHVLECVFPITGSPYCQCKCKPEHREYENGALIIVHNSFDGREGVEWANEILKTI